MILKNSGDTMQSNEKTGRQTQCKSGGGRTKNNFFAKMKICQAEKNRKSLRMVVLREKHKQRKIKKKKLRIVIMRNENKGRKDVRVTASSKLASIISPDANHGAYQHSLMIWQSIVRGLLCIAKLRSPFHLLRAGNPLSVTRRGRREG